MKLKTDILILGSGITGLAFSYYLSKKNIDNVIIEKDSVIGGLSKTIKLNSGNFFDIGGHRLYFKDKLVEKEILNDVLEGRYILHYRRSAIYISDSFFEYPPTVADFFKYLRFYKMFINFLFDKGKRKYDLKLKHTNNLEYYLISRYGFLLYNIYFKEYTEKVWGRNVFELSADWALRRIGDNNIFDFVLDYIFKHLKIKENADIFYYPSNGIGDLCISFYNKSRTKLINNVRVFNLVWHKLCCVSGNQNYEICFKKIISTIPLHELSNILSFKNIVSKLFYRSLIVVYIEFKDEFDIPEYHWIYFPQKDIIFSRVSNINRWVNIKNNNRFTFEIMCNFNDNIWNTSDEKLLDMVVEDLKKIKIFDKLNKVKDFYIVREKYAYPVLDVSYKEKLSSIRDYVSTNYPFIHLSGRNGTHSYYDIEECVNSAKQETDILYNTLYDKK